MGADRVVFVGECVDAVGEVDAAGDVVAVEVLVFEGADPAFDDAVGPRGAVAGPDVGEVGAGGEPGATATDFMAGPLSVTTTRGTISPVAASTQSSARGRPSSSSAASTALCSAEIKSVAP